MVDVIAGGTGDNGDAQLVADELRGLPDPIVDALRERRVSIVACRDTVVDFAPRLSGVHPTNWPAGKTWDVVPGAYLPDERAVVVATVERAGRRAVPALNDRHGSASLAVHEVMHGFDFSADRRPSQSGPFLSRWRADFARLKDDYFQDSETGSAEAYAESAARTYGLWAGLKDVWPNLRDYWLRPDRTYARTAPGGPAAASGPRPLGIGRLAEDGTVHLFLTALGNNGEHGHALIELAPNQLRGSPAWAAEGREVGETFDIFSLEGLEF